MPISHKDLRDDSLDATKEAALSAGTMSFLHLKQGDTVLMRIPDCVTGTYRETFWDVVWVYPDGRINFGGRLDYNPDTGQAIPWDNTTPTSSIHPRNAR